MNSIYITITQRFWSFLEHKLLGTILFDMLLRISIGRVLILFGYQIYFRKSSKDRHIYRRIAKGEVGKYYVKFMTNVNCMDLNPNRKSTGGFRAPPLPPPFVVQF